MAREELNFTRYVSRPLSITGEHQPGAQTCDTAEQKARLVKTLSRSALTAADKLRDDAPGDTTQGESGEGSELVQLARSLQRLAALTGARAETAAHHADNSTQSTTEINANVSTEHVGEQNLEIMQQVENGRPVSHLPPTPLTLTDVKSVQKRDVGGTMRYYVKHKLWNGSMQQVENGRSVSHLPPTPLTDIKSVQKRDIGDAMRYYVKYKVWNGSNPIDGHRTNADHQFDVKNSFKALSIRKRSIADKKAANMQSVIQTNRVKCHPKGQSGNKSKLVKFIKVYRRKVIQNIRH